MAKLDWTNVNWSALLGSKVVVGNIVTIIATTAAITGHNLPESMQSQLMDLITQLFTMMATLSAVYSTFHRISAQPEDATVIVPKKTTASTPTTGAPT
jgi:fumarate reductase subunit D